MENKKILILGATGQIGKELSLKFKKNQNYEVIYHGRTQVSLSFFKHHELNCIAGDLQNRDVISKISSSDLIFDLAAPNTGSLKEIKNFYKQRLNLIFTNMKKNKKFIFASSMNAFGIDNQRKVLKKYLFSSSIYASSKRFAERYCQKLGKKNSIDTYILRLSEVHGEYQRASLELIKLINEKYVFELPKYPAWITFISVIKQSILNILNNKEKPGLYTLVCDDVYWVDLLNLLSKNKKLSPKYEIKSKEKGFDKINNFIYRFIISKKDVFRGNLSINKSFEDTMKINYRVKKVKNLVKKFKGTKVYNEKNRYIGVLPGERLKSLEYKIEDILN
ncbi:NAD(P)-dependent oxidoreductase [Candidatus Pelagibacter sp.]|nr:NAD(P)-dependent oxidoreductase [Candidatus Pelagibacter sp.]